jgi:hypothetical protein
LDPCCSHRQRHPGPLGHNRLLAWGQRAPLQAVAASYTHARERGPCKPCAASHHGDGGWRRWVFEEGGGFLKKGVLGFGKVKGMSAWRRRVGRTNKFKPVVVESGKKPKTKFPAPRPCRLEPSGNPRRVFVFRRGTRCLQPLFTHTHAQRATTRQIGRAHV